MKTKFSLYRTKLNEKDGKIYYYGYKHSFGCTLTEALLQWKCFIQIFTGRWRFYESVGENDQATKFNILSFPIWYLYAFATTSKFYKIILI